MGEHDIDPIIEHFSHQHPLKLLNFQHQATSAVTCAGCEQEVSGWIYSCSACNYCLHKTCSQMPQHKKLQIDPKHSLQLLSSPVYHGGTFKCNACGKIGRGFCYNCKECQIDIHTLCAFMPPSVNIKTHHHTLNLLFNPPYQRKRFQCDICKDFGSNHWLYHCDSCNFDAHMTCAMANFLSLPTFVIQQKQPNFQSQAASGIQQKQQQQLHHHQKQQQQHQLPKFKSVPPQIPNPSLVQTVHHLHPAQQKQPNFQSQPDSGIQPIQQQQQHHQHSQHLQQQQHQLLKSQSVPHQIPNPNLIQTVYHHQPPPQQQILNTHIQTQNPIPQVESLNMSQPTIVYVPQYVQPPTDTLGKNMLDYMVKGVMNSITQQATQVMFDNIFEG